ncbi:MULTISPECIES: thioesterase II family protein [unclassified Streptomyces]|uniref:thioesterase II family protein n=1 Tax=unclassified Streptomyces TaxID=2593676 RepID=UPI0035D6F00B
MARTERDLWIRGFGNEARRAAAADAPFELICFPHAGGSASYWWGLAEALAGDADVLSVQYPGRQDRFGEPAVTDLHRTADLVAGVLDGPGDRPRVLLGHSMGASLAYEVGARLSRSAGAGPDLLVVSARRAPSVPETAWDRTGDDAALVRRVRALGGTDPAFLDDPDLLELILPGLRGDYEALASYRGTTGTPLSCPVLALAADADPSAPVEEVEAWRRHTSGAFRLRVFEGGHFYLADRIDELAELIRRSVTASAR